MYVIGALIIILILALVARGCQKAKTTGETVESSSEIESSSGEENQITVDGVVISGMTRMKPGMRY